MLDHDRILEALADDSATDYTTWRLGRIARQWVYNGRLVKEKILRCPHCGQKGAGVGPDPTSVTHALRGVRIARMCQRRGRREGREIIRDGPWGTYSHP